MRWTVERQPPHFVISSNCYMEKYLSNKEFIKLLGISIVAVIIATGYKFYIKKDYDFIVETPCDPISETCFYRDCLEGECPPNGLENYKIFTLKAYDFSSCSDKSCFVECTSNAIACTETVCGESREDICSN